ncbi:MAG TPA: hydrogenase nickel incorporation protein HypB [Bellilinea sp.]|nr:hydrogenase nickel incorporation protein HypB [Bellilinea sp.]
MTKKIEIIERILSANDRLANDIRVNLDKKGILGLNMMASPGAGKTSFILRTIAALKPEFTIGVIEGDTAPVTIDAEKVIAEGMPAVQINTGGECHLDAVMMQQGLAELPLGELDLVIVENVGNLICPAAFDLGTHLNVLIASIPEGDDKPYKYTNMYRGVDVLIVNKTDLMPYIDFRMDYFRKGVETLNPGLTTFLVSCKTGEGMEDWVNWLKQEILKKKGH